MHLHTTSAAALALLPIALVAGADTLRDKHCAPPLKSSFTHNTYTYTVPLPQITQITKDFFDIEWYGGVVVSTHTGRNGVPGATRSGNFTGGSFHETLTEYTLRPDAFAYAYSGVPYTFAPPHAQPVHFGVYAETLRFESVCGGRATYIDFQTWSCVDDRPAGYNFWYTLHQTAAEGLAQTLKANVLAGDCD
ncbi:unnamed protein product [Mycena citricolor]|uniref:Uncharacterized protein n=1 Tax=Mycena citricolor TaxID=2018698 RepID=A0AAD2HWX2_9AGAR|nr:unnamed protein product [Mycena citricolor]